MILSPLQKIHLKKLECKDDILLILSIISLV